MSHSVPKNEREHWAARRIDELERENAVLKEAVEQIRELAAFAHEAHGNAIVAIDSAHADLADARKQVKALATALEKAGSDTDAARHKN